MNGRHNRKIGLPASFDAPALCFLKHDVGGGGPHPRGAQFPDAQQIIQRTDAARSLDGHRAAVSMREGNHRACLNPRVPNSYFPFGGQTMAS